ncbi:hypothetical protein M408DRAFT_328580 [Serendipita vermifera MAFF 305830]|uniref:RING-type E3 ubiquitin transferase n=1 Tax=Serendipita vermifera MAFF 305830 TaxID=933852 RepID=A0A0C3AYW3_SERVB|nr:hypothetical protein M408DRAFT_328580 [Serendipita vermifera MAFF 305830]
MSAATSSLASPTSAHLISPQSAVSYTPYTNAQRPLASASLAQAIPLPSNALAAEADAPLNLGLDEEEVVWGGESVGLGFGLLSRLKDKTNALLEAIDWDCRICGKTATDPCVTRCGHLFCWSHLTKHLASVPLCPKCTSPLSMDRDVVQVFGRPKAIPSDAPWTNANQTPGSTGSTADLINRSELASPARELSIPPPSVSPVPLRSRSTSSLDSSSQETTERNRKQKSRKRALKPLTKIQPIRSKSDDSAPRPPNVLVTRPDSDSSRSDSRGLSDNAKEEKEEDPWLAWRRLSDANTVVPGSSSRTQRPSAVRLYSQDNLRPPSPQLRTKQFRPGWATRQKQESTDSFDDDLRQSIEVKFTRGSQFDDRNRQQAEAESEDDDADGNVIYLHSPAFKKATLGLELDLAPKILSPTPKYAYSQSASGLENAVLSPQTTTATEDDFKAHGRKWFEEHRRSSGLDSMVVTPPTTSFRPSDIASSHDFSSLKVAVKDATGGVEEKKQGSIMTDPIGRALCVFAVVLLVKILLK